MLAVTDLRTGYGAIEAVHGVSLEVGPGRAVAVIGANGAGKSALLQAIAGVLRHSGRVLLEDRDIASLSAAERCRAGISLVPEGRRIFAGMSVMENLLCGAIGAGRNVSRSDTLKRVFELFPMLESRRAQRADTLSGGEQQMLAIGRALMSAPRLLMLDEPSLGLAPLVVEEVFKTLQTLRGSGLAILLVEQAVQHALQFSDHAYLLEDGAFVLSERSHALMDHPRVRSAYLVDPAMRRSTQ